MTLAPEITSACKQLGYELYKTENTVLTNLIKQFGYEPLGYGTTYDNGVQGELMTLPEETSKYNNGVYMLIRQEDGATVMETIVPNNRDKGNMIQQAVDAITTQVKGMNMDDFQLFDYVEMWGYVIAETTLKPLAKTLYPDQPNDTSEEKALKQAKRERFVLLAMPRTLVNMAHYYTGDQAMVEEERVNSEPYVIKMMIDQETNKHSQEDTE